MSSGRFLDHRRLRPAPNPCDLVPVSLPLPPAPASFPLPPPQRASGEWHRYTSRRLFAAQPRRNGTRHDAQDHHGTCLCPR